MAKMNSILGNVYGKLGEVVGQNWMGKQVLRKYNGRIANPHTAEQERVRAIFGHLMGMTRGFYEVLDLTLRNEARKRGPMTAANLFLKRNFDKVEINDDGELTVDYQNLVVSEGKLKGVNFGTMSLDDGLGLTVNYTGQQLEKSTCYASPLDQVYLFAYCEELNEGEVSEPTKRTNNQLSMTLPADWAGNKVMVYGFVVGGERYLTGGKTSRSHYLGSKLLV